jgi:hypothetical protein
MKMRSGRKFAALYGPSEDDFLPEDDADFLAPPSASPASENIVPFSQPLDGIAVGMQLVQVLPLLQQTVRQLSDLRSDVVKLQARQAPPPPKSDFDEVGYLDAESARKYLSMSKNTFEKYVYSEKVKIPRYRVGGKNFFKKKDLDLFVLTWEDKNLS